MHNKDFKERMWRSTKWGTSRFHEDACSGLCMFVICELCVDYWISIVHYYYYFGIFECLEFLIFIVKFMEFL
jgi:hypothetical protein